MGEVTSGSEFSRGSAGGTAGTGGWGRGSRGTGRGPALYEPVLLTTRPPGASQNRPAPPRQYLLSTTSSSSSGTANRIRALSSFSLDLNAAVAAATAAAAAAANTFGATQGAGVTSRTSTGLTGQSTVSLTGQTLHATSGTSSFSNPLWEDSGAGVSLEDPAVAGTDAGVAAVSRDIAMRLAETYGQGAAADVPSSQAEQHDGGGDMGYGDDSSRRGLLQAAGSSVAEDPEGGLGNWRGAAGATGTRSRRTSSGSLKKSYSASSEELEGLLQQLSEYEQHLYSQPYFNKSAVTSASGSTMGGEGGTGAASGSGGAAEVLEERAAEGSRGLGPGASYDLGSASSLSWSQTLQSLEDFELKLSKSGAGGT